MGKPVTKRVHTATQAHLAAVDTMVIVFLDVKMEVILPTVVICFSLLFFFLGGVDALFVFVLVCFPLFFMLNGRIIGKNIINRHYNDFEKYAIHSIYHMYRY